MMERSNKGCEALKVTDAYKRAERLPELVSIDHQLWLDVEVGPECGSYGRKKLALLG